MQLPRRKFHPGKPFTFPSAERISMGSRDPAAEWWQLPAGGTGTPVLDWKGRERPRGEESHCSPADFTIRVWASTDVERGFPTAHPKTAAARPPHHASPLPPEASPIRKAETPQLLPLDGCKAAPHRPGPKSQGLLCPYANTHATDRAPPETQ